MQPVTRIVASAAFIIAWSTAAMAQDSRYAIDIRAVGLLGDGVPANDILGFGLGGRYYLSDGWFVGAALENYAYDFERPIELVGLRQDPNVKVIDADGTNTVLSVSLGRLYAISNGPLQWHWMLGLGVGFPDVKDVIGPTSTGEMFDLTIKSGTEIHFMSALGLAYAVTPAVSVFATARAEHHFIDHQVADRVSGMSGKVDSQSPLGANFGVAWRF